MLVVVVVVCLVYVDCTLNIRSCSRLLPVLLAFALVRLWWFGCGCVGRWCFVHSCSHPFFAHTNTKTKQIILECCVQVGVVLLLYSYRMRVVFAFVREHQWWL